MSTDTGETLVVRFEDVSVAEAGQNVAALRNQILDQCPDVQAEIRKPDPTTQDFGTTLVLVLGAPAAVVLAKGLARALEKYLARDRKGELVIEKDGDVIFRGNSGDAATIAKAFASKTK